MHFVWGGAGVHGARNLQELREMVAAGQFSDDLLVIRKVRLRQDVMLSLYFRETGCWLSPKIPELCACKR